MCIRVKDQKQPRHPSAAECMSSVWYIYEMEYQWAISLGYIVQGEKLVKKDRCEVTPFTVTIEIGESIYRESGLVDARG